MLLRSFRGCCLPLVFYKNNKGATVWEQNHNVNSIKSVDFNHEVNALKINPLSIFQEFRILYSITIVILVQISFKYFSVFATYLKYEIKWIYWKIQENKRKNAINASLENHFCSFSVQLCVIIPQSYIPTWLYLFVLLRTSTNIAAISSQKIQYSFTCFGIIFSIHLWRPTLVK